MGGWCSMCVGGERMRMQKPKQLENHLLNFQTKHYDICLPIPVSTSNKRLLRHNSAVHAIIYIYIYIYMTLCEYI